MANSYKILYFTSTTILFVATDWFTKILAKKYLFYERAKDYFNGIFILDYAENKGAALSLGSNLPENQAFWVLQLLPAFILVGLLFYIFSQIKTLNIWHIIMYAAIFSGGFANLFDRFQNNRHVIDFMVVKLGGFQTGIFNFADLFISFGVL